MKITSNQLKSIISEEIGRVLSEHQILSAMSGISDDDKWFITDQALAVAGIMLGVGPDVL